LPKDRKNKGFSISMGFEDRSECPERWIGELRNRPAAKEDRRMGPPSAGW
jgi:hypothetical protein